MSEEMKPFSSLLAPIIEKAMAAQPHDDSDYVDEEGYLCCGKCRTRKQYEIDFPDLKGGWIKKKVPSTCKCEQERREAEERERQRRKDMEIVAQLKKQSLMDARFQEQTFDLFRTTQHNQRVLKLAKRYADGFDEMLERNQGLLFWGDVGTGKTFAAACIANALLSRKIPVVMTSFVKLLENVKGFDNDEEVLLAKLNRAKLLIIDDLGAERGTEYALEKVYNIIDSRYRAKLPMILTTNLDLEEMKNASEIRYSRIYDRIFEVCYPVKFTGTSFRKAEAAKRFNDMKAFLEGDDYE